MRAGDFLAALASFPVRTMEEIAPGTTLVVAPHPDDESLGCGGFIAAAAALGRPPVVVIVSDGAASHLRSRKWPPERLAALREAEAREALGILGVSPNRLHFLYQPDGAVPSEGPVFDAVVQSLAAVIRQYDCRNIIVPWRYDPHCDHEAVWLAGRALKALRPELTCLSCPIWGVMLPHDLIIDASAPEGPAPDAPAPEGSRLDVSAYLDTKREAVRAHKSQRGLVIDDDPDGFVLPEALLEKLMQPYEYFITS